MDAAITMSGNNLNDAEDGASLKNMAATLKRLIASTREDDIKLEVKGKRKRREHQPPHYRHLCITESRAVLQDPDSKREELRARARWLKISTNVSQEKMYLTP
ncbi:hypothetical protein YC2023_094436 [Brassica napus]